MENILKETEVKMKKTIGVFHNELSTIRTGRANTSVLDGVKVDYYGTMTPVNQVASVAVIEAKTIDIKPWDKSVLAPVEKAILAANLGLSVVNTGDSLKVKFPELTEETRAEMVKKVKKMGEESKVDIRNIRREANDRLKEKEKNKEMSEDEKKNGENKVQKMTDQHIKEIDDIIKDKEKSLMTI